MCFICGRGNCTPSFHSFEEQDAYYDAAMAYDNYLEVRARCEQSYYSSIEEEKDE